MYETEGQQEAAARLLLAYLVVYQEELIAYVLGGRMCTPENLYLYGEDLVVDIKGGQYYKHRADLDRPLHRRLLQLAWIAGWPTVDVKSCFWMIDNPRQMTAHQMATCYPLVEQDRTELERA